MRLFFKILKGRSSKITDIEPSEHTSSQLHKMGEEEEATRVLAELAEAEKAVPPGAHLVDQSDMQYRDYVSVFDLISQRDARSVRELSELNWVTCGKSHVLSLIGKQSVKIVTSHKAGFGTYFVLSLSSIFKKEVYS